MNTTQSPFSRPIEILLVDDDLADVKFTQRALKMGQVTDNLHVAMDGIEAMRFLRRQGQFANAPRPDLVLLDLNMPRMDGRQVLQEIKSDEQLKAIPVVILSTSDADVDIAASYMGHANSYIMKPADPGQFNSAVLTLAQYWFSVAKLPQKVGS